MTVDQAREILAEVLAMRRDVAAMREDIREVSARLELIQQKANAIVALLTPK